MTKDQEKPQWFEEHEKEDIKSFGALDKKLDDSIAQNVLILEQQAIILEKLKPVDNLTGFWKVLGFLLGAIGLFAAGVAGFKFLVGLVPIKVVGATILTKTK